MSTLKDFYINEYPTDMLGYEIKNDATFEGLLYALISKICPYDYYEVYDSIVRERLLSELASRINKPYEYLYDLLLETESIPRIYFTPSEFETELSTCLTIIQDATEKNQLYVCQYVSPSLNKKIVFVSVVPEEFKIKLINSTF